MPMTKAITTSLAAAFIVACGPSVDDESLGTLEYEHSAAQFHRHDRRVTMIPLDSMQGSHECGFLTDRAYDDLTTTIDALDPSWNYRILPDGCGPGERGFIHLEGFAHTPFECEVRCCHSHLEPILVVYSAVEDNFSGVEPIVDGEPYVAIEPEEPCP
jgi:hypothetical protein